MTSKVLGMSWLLWRTRHQRTLLPVMTTLMVRSRSQALAQAARARNERAEAAEYVFLTTVEAEAVYGVV